MSFIQVLDVVLTVVALLLSAVLLRTGLFVANRPFRQLTTVQLRNRNRLRDSMLKLNFIASTVTLGLVIVFAQYGFTYAPFAMVVLYSLFSYLVYVVAFNKTR